MPDGKTARLGVKDRRTGTVAATPVQYVTTATATAMAAATTVPAVRRSDTDGTPHLRPTRGNGLHTDARVIQLHTASSSYLGPVSSPIGVENYWSLLEACIGRLLPTFMADEHRSCGRTSGASVPLQPLSRHVMDKMLSKCAATNGAGMAAHLLDDREGRGLSVQKIPTPPSSS